MKSMVVSKRSFPLPSMRTATMSFKSPEMERLRGYLAEKGLELPDAPAHIQNEWSLPFMRWVVEQTTSKVECSMQPHDPPGIFIGTHRDIVCDPALFNLARVEAGLETTHIVLGSNLAKVPWVKDLLVANKAIFIDRELTGRAAMEQHKGLSRRIASIVQDGGHVWIAQAPGRSKDGKDETHVGLLRMLGMAWGGEEQGAAALKGLLRPVSMRYDVNPCDALLLREKLTGHKAQGDDERSMRAGLEGWKGVVRIAEGEAVQVPEDLSREGWQILASDVDRAIVDLGISGQWAAEAQEALTTGDPGALSPEFLTRIEWAGQQLSNLTGPLDSEQVWTGMCEIYREESDRV